MTAATNSPAPEARAHWSSPRVNWALAVTVALVTLALDARVAGFQLTFFDDATYLTDNAQLRAGLSWDSVAWAFTTLHFGNWHPLTWLSWLLDVQLFGFDAGAFHLGNALLHAVNAGLLLLVLERLTGARWRSALAAALFALHPLHVEAVAWASERKELLAALFGLLALMAYARHAARPSASRFAVVALAFAASLASKAMWVTLPFLLLLLDIWPLQRWSGSPLPVDPETPSRPRRTLGALVVEKLPLLALAAATAAVTLVAQRRGGAVSGLELGLGTRAGNALVAYARYLGKALWPADLSVFYPYPVDGWQAWQVAGAALLLATLSGLALRRGRTAPVLLMGWCWFLGALVPVIGLVQVGGQSMADRYTYLPGIGLWVAAAWGAERLARRVPWRRPVQAVAAATLLACAAGSWNQLGFWVGHETLFRHALAVDPGNAQAHANLAYGFWRGGRRAEALDEARQAVVLGPGGVRAWVNLGEMFRELGRREEALRALREAVRINPEYVPAWLGLGAAEADAGHLGNGVAALRHAVRLAPEDALGWKGLGELEAFRGRRAEAAGAFREALRILPGDPGLTERLRRVETGEPGG